MLDTNLIIGKKNTGKTRYILFNEVKKAINNGDNLCIFNTRDEYYTGPKFGESFKETRDKAEYNAYVQSRLDAGEDPHEPKRKNP